jgi:hypothetical protein
MPKSDFCTLNPSEPACVPPPPPTPFQKYNPWTFGTYTARWVNKKKACKTIVLNLNEVNYQF